MRKRAKYSARLLCGTAMAVVTMAAAPAMARADGPAINIEPQSLATALREFASQSQRAILVSPALADNKSSRGVRDATDPEAALTALLEGTGLTYRRSGELLEPEAFADTAAVDRLDVETTREAPQGERSDRAG